MPWQFMLPYLMHQPVGVSLIDGQGVSGVLCGFDNGQIYLMEYLYQSQFAMKHYPVNMIQDISPFPPCRMPIPIPYGPVY